MVVQWLFKVYRGNFCLWGKINLVELNHTLSQLFFLKAQGKE